MTLTSIVRALVKSGATPEMILSAVAAAEAVNSDALAKRRRADAERQRRRRSCHVTPRDVTVTGADGVPLKERSPRPPKENNPSPTSSNPDGLKDSRTRDQTTEKVQLEADFAAWWEVQPQKVRKPKAKSAYLTARKRGVTAVQLLAGLKHYIATKPNWREFAHPATWLNGEGWNDAPAPPPMAAVAPDRPRSVSERRVEGLGALAEAFSRKQAGGRIPASAAAGGGEATPRHEAPSDRDRREAAPSGEHLATASLGEDFRFELELPAQRVAAGRR